MSSTNTTIAKPTIRNLLCIVFGVAALSSLAYWYLEIPVVTNEQGSLIREGMPRSRVYTMLGEPHRVYIGPTKNEVWVYYGTRIRNFTVYPYFISFSSSKFPYGE